MCIKSNFISLVSCPHFACSNVFQTFPDSEQLCLALAAELLIFISIFTSFSMVSGASANPITACPPVEYRNTSLSCCSPSHTLGVSLPTRCYCAGHWDLCVSAVGDILPVPACRVLERNLINPLQPPPPPFSVWK